MSYENLNIVSLPVFNVKNFGAKGDGIHDDTAAIQAALNYVSQTGHRLHFPSGTYLASSTLTVQTPVFGNNLHITGDGPNITIIRYNGVSGGDLFIAGGVVGFGWTSTIIEYIQFDGNLTARSCFWIQPVATGITFRQVVFSNIIGYTVWQPNTVYQVGAKVIAPSPAAGGITNWGAPDNGHYYTCTTSNSPHTSGSSVSFNTAHNSTTTDGYLVWTESGPSPCCFLVSMFSDTIPGGLGNQVSEINYEFCSFGGAPLNCTLPLASQPCGAGWRTLLGSNTENFNFHRCDFDGCVVGIDWSQASSNWSGFYCQFEGNWVDISVGRAVFGLTGFASEGSQQFMVTGQGGNVSIKNGIWIGDGYGNPGSLYYETPVIYSGAAAMTISGCFFADTNVNQSITTFVQGLDLTNFPQGGLKLENCIFGYNNSYSGPFFTPVYWTNGGLFTEQSWAVRQHVNYFNNTFQNNSSSSTLKALPNFSASGVENGFSLVDQFQTSNNTPTISSGSSWTLPGAFCSGFVELRVIAKNESSGHMLAWSAIQAFRSTPSTVTLLGSLINMGGNSLASIGDTSQSDINTATITITSSGATIQPEVTGINSQTIGWSLEARYQYSAQ